MDYSKFNFPPYEYKEYPKWVEVKGRQVLVESKEEEDAVKIKPKREKE